MHRAASARGWAAVVRGRAARGRSHSGMVLGRATGGAHAGTGASVILGTTGPVHAAGGAAGTSATALGLATLFAAERRRLATETSGRCARGAAPGGGVL